MKQAGADEPTIGSSQLNDDTLADIDMDISEHKKAAGDFHSDETPNIWTLSDEQNMSSDEAGEDELADKEIDRPSFLRRFGRRKERTGSDEQEPKNQVDVDENAAKTEVEKPTDE